MTSPQVYRHSIIHGKAEHEETKATSHARSRWEGHYLVVLTLAETDYVCDYIRHGGNKQAFLEKFRNAHSPGFDPDMHLKTVGVANQTTMLRARRRRCSDGFGRRLSIATVRN